MRKILCRALLCLCLVLALGPVHTAFAQDLDRIESYAVDVTPNTEDGSLRIQVTLEWTVLAEGPVSWVKIGVPNGSIRQEQALTDNIDRLSFDNSYMYVYFNRDYDDGETFRFSYSWIQEYMYTLGADGSVEYVYTPGWFNEARVGQMTLTWHDPAGVDGVDVTMSVNVGDKVIYSKYAGNEVKLDGEEYIIVRQSDILAVVE